MFSRKVPNTVLNTKPNLKNILMNNTSNKRYFFRYNFTIREITVSDVFKNIRHVKDKMKGFLLNGMVLRSLQNTVLNVPRTLKDQSAGVLRVWAHQCECVFAQRLRRGQQMFCLYTKLWEERALRDLLSRMRQQITKRGKEIMFSAVGIASYNWDTNRISNEEIRQHMNELDYIHVLSEKTVLCEKCKKKLRCTTPSNNNADDSSTANIIYCACRNKTTRKKTFEDWMLFIEKKDMVVWRKMHDSGYYEYKVYGSFNDVTAEDFLNVQIDTEYRKKWDTTAINLEIVEKDPIPHSNSDVVYWEMLWPKLFVNRDYVFNRRFMIDVKNKTIVIMSRGTKHPACPARPDKFRVDTYWSYMVIKPYTELNKPGIEFGLTYYDNPGVNIPAAVTTWVAMRAMPDFLIRLRIASKEYRTYCENMGDEYVCNFYQDQISWEEDEQQRQDETEELIIDNTIFEAQHPIMKPARNSVKPRSSQAREPVENKSEVDSTSKASIGTPGSEIMTSPSPTIEAETGRHSYWKYLRPNHYFS